MYVVRRKQSLIQKNLGSNTLEIRERFNLDYGVPSTLLMLLQRRCATSLADFPTIVKHMKAKNLFATTVALLAANAGNLAAGRLTDRYGSRYMIIGALAIAALDFAVLPGTPAHLWSTAFAIVVWGVCGWGLLVPQQHRLITLSPGSAPLLLGLNSAALCVGVSASGVVGAAAVEVFNRHQLGYVGAVLVAVALVIAKQAYRLIRI